MCCVMAAIADAAATEPASPVEVPSICWSNAELAQSQGEERVQRMVRAAFRDPIKRDLAPFTPLPRSGVVRRVKLPPGKKLVALTFDLCEEPFEIAGYQGGIVDYLRANKIKATFFAGGKWMLTHRKRAMQLMSDPLFAIGNHTWEHRNVRLLSGGPLRDEIANAQTAYEQVREELEQSHCALPGQTTPASERVPKRLTMIRFPFGACSGPALETVAALGVRPIQWDVSSGDAPPGQSPQEMLKDVLNGVRPGSIVLFHANGRGVHTTEAIPIIVAALKAKGYEFATVTELLQSGEPEVVPTCYDKKPGDADRYDRLSEELEGTYRRARSTVLGGAEARQGAAPPSPAALSTDDETSSLDSAETTFDTEMPLEKVPRKRSRSKD
jgi:peptidoglycan-N-acetylglucosamine deacetylase